MIIHYVLRYKTIYFRDYGNIEYFLSCSLMNAFKLDSQDGGRDPRKTGQSTDPYYRDQWAAPEKEIRTKNWTDLWINNEILQQTENRDKLLKRLTRHRDDADLRLEYNRARNKLARDIVNAKAEYYHNATEEHKHEPRKLWQLLKTTGYSEKSKDSPTIWY